LDSQWTNFQPSSQAPSLGQIFSKSKSVQLAVTSSVERLNWGLCQGHRLTLMDESEFEDYDRDAEVSLYREYRDVVKMFRYVVETERRFYLCNEVELKRIDTATDFYFEINMQDVWVWDIYRTDRFVKQVKVMTFKDVNLEEIGKRDIEIPEELAVGDKP
jgi:hypothetical protein